MSLLPKELVADVYRKEVNVYGRLIGEAPFMRQTGISPHHWRGGYWPSWSEFQRELGFVPNQRARRTPDEVLLRELADLALRLERLPTAHDLVERKKEDPSFPCYKAIQRLGRNTVRLLRLTEYCEGNPEFAPVARMLERRRVEYMARNGRDSLRVLGFVYLARRSKPDEMIYEIGCEHAAGKRLEYIARRMSRLPGTIHMIDTDDPEGVQFYWRRRFRSRRVGGKYFRLFPEDVLVFQWRRFQ